MSTILGTVAKDLDDWTKELGTDEKSWRFQKRLTTAAYWFLLLLVVALGATSAILPWVTDDGDTIDIWFADVDPLVAVSIMGTAAAAVGVVNSKWAPEAKSGFYAILEVKAKALNRELNSGQPTRSKLDAIRPKIDRLQIAAAKPPKGTGEFGEIYAGFTTSDDTSTPLTPTTTTTPQ